MAQVWLEVSRSLAESLVIPFNSSDYGRMLNSFLNDLDKFLLEKNMNNSSTGIANYSKVMQNLYDSVQRFQLSASIFQSKVDLANSGIKKFTLQQVEMLNARMVSLERCFINPRGLPKRPHERHVVFSRSIHDPYTGKTFSGVRDSVEYYYKALKNGDKKDAAEWLKTIHMCLTEIQYSLESAIIVLNLDGF